MQEPTREKRIAELGTDCWRIPRRLFGKFGGARPYAFTEQGVAMLSGVPRLPRAVAVDIAIMRTFVHLRRLMDSQFDSSRGPTALEMNSIRSGNVQKECR